MKRKYCVVNPLQRDGTSQRQRFPEALDPASIGIDEKEVQDLLVFAEKFAREIQYWDPDNTTNEDWVHFVEKDISLVLATILTTRTQKYRDEFVTMTQVVEKLIEQAKSGLPVNPVALNQAFHNMLWFLLNTKHYINQSDIDTLALIPLLVSWNERVTSDSALDSEISGLIRSELIERLKELAWINFELSHFLNANGFPDIYVGVTPGTYVMNSDPKDPLNIDISDYNELFDEFIGPGNAMVDYINDIPNQFNPAAPLYYKGNNAEDQIANVLRGIKLVFESFLNTAQLIISRTPDYFEESLNDFDLHEPHFALYIAFLRMYRHNQEHVNGLTKRHLDYFYQEVLRLEKREGIPDKVNVLFKIRNSAEQVKLEAGSRLQAGADALGNPLYYETQREIVLNRGQVTDLKTLFLSQPRLPFSKIPTKGIEVYASPIANSSDGIGADLADNNPKWNTFGEDQIGKNGSNRTMPDGEMGFAIASPQLYLTSGRRFARFIFTLDKGSEITSMSKLEQAHLEAALVQSLRVKLSSDKQWIETKPSRVIIFTDDILFSDTNALSLNLADPQNKLDFVHFDLVDELGTVNFEQEDALIIEVELGPEMPEVLPFDGAKLKSDYKTTHPIAIFSIDNKGKSVSIDETAWIFPGTGVTSASWGLFMGNFYRKNANVIEHSDCIDSFLEDQVLPFDEDTTYDPLNLLNLTKTVSYDGRIYIVAKASTSPPPDVAADFWKRLGPVPPIPFAPDYDPDATYSNPGNSTLVNHKGWVYMAIKASVSPLPDRNPEYWVERDYTVNLYQIMRSIQPKELNLKVGVFGLKDLIVESDGGPMNPNKPFQPFGFRPEVGGKFYLGSGEAFGKKLSSFGLNIEWLDPPADFGSYYSQYPGTVTNSDFKAEVNLLDEAKWKKVLTANADAELFHATDATLPTQITVDLENQSNPGELIFPYYGRDDEALPNQYYDSSLKRGFVQLELSGPPMAFGHGLYGELYATEIAINLNNPVLPKEPYTPVIKSISLDYISNQIIDIDSRAPGGFTRRVEQFFHLHPFGQAEMHGSLILDESALTLLPSYEDEGNLMIGIEGLESPQSLSLLFQLAEGSADPDLLRGDIHWQVLSDNQWLDLAPINIVFDSSNELNSSGILVFDIPKEANTEHTMLPSGLHWLKASLSEGSLAMNKCIDIHAQAVPAAFVDKANDPEHLREALPAKSIKHLQYSRSGIEKVSQPYSSFDGRLAEGDREFSTRVSERLRHKDRSSTVWDYERMVLEEYPGIYKVKCLNHTDNDCEIAPGNVTVITIPNLRNKNAVNIFEPRTSLDMLDKIRDYLLFTISPFVNLIVRNPLYEQIRVSCGIGFHPGFDAGFYSKQLKEEVEKFLSPWAFDEGEEIVFGGRIHSSVILNFIEERSYVNYVVNFRMDHIFGDTVCEDVLEAVATTSRSILVSSLEHSIIPVGPGDYKCVGSQHYEGIDFWIMTEDFEVS